MEISKESWEALYRGQLRDCERIMDLQERLCKMSRQVEKRSFQVEALAEWIVDEIEADWTVDGVLDGLERDWNSWLAQGK